MCGFGGILNSKSLITNKEVFDIARKVKFRGPDSTRVILLDDNYKSTENASRHALFFNRLAILDLNKRSDQPFSDGRFILLFNGEIYNYRTLKKQLQKQDVVFTTSSDTEVLFEALKCWNIKALEKLNGMFSLVFIDLLTKDVILARDRMGIKPMYYSISNDTIAFASECDSIVRLQQKPLEIDQTALQAYLWLQYTPTPTTIHRSISKLPPGSYLKMNLEKRENSSAITSFWDSYDHIYETLDPYENLNELLKESLKLQIHADVPVGVFLSSGVDSSLLAAIINQEFAKSNCSFNFFTIAFDEVTDSDESMQAQQFIKGFQNPLLDHRILHLSSASIIEKARKMYQVYDEPFADPAALLNWAISENASEYAKVVLSGDGADELFWGYDRYTIWQNARLKNERFFLITALKGWIQERIRGKYNTIYTTSPLQLHYNLLKTESVGSVNPVLEHRFWSNIKNDILYSRPDAASLIDLKTYLPDAMLYKVDRSSMAVSIEVRVPYLDNRIIDYSLRLPLENKTNSTFHSKAILKELLYTLAPHYQNNLIKKGFSMPVRKWMQNEWKKDIEEVVTGTNWEQFSIEKKLVNNLLKNFYQKNINCANDIWHLYHFALWIETKRSIL